MAIRLIAGLGNPGRGHARDRHNVGFWLLDRLAAAHGVVLAKDTKHQALVARLAAPAGDLWLCEPQTYMNLSGRSVGGIARFYKIAPDEILVVHDELDLLPGQAKIKQGGSAAGHNGLKDIHAQLGTLDFWRLRIGIGHPGVKAEVVNWVLKKPSPTDRDAIDLAIEKSLGASDLLIEGAMDRALQLIHAGPQRPKPPKPPKVPPGDSE